MVLRRHREQQGEAADLPRHRRWRWLCVAVLLPLVAAGLIAALLADLLPAHDLTAGKATLLTAVLAAVLVGLVLASLYAIWRARLEELARRPGPILVLPALDRTSPDAPTDSALARRMTGEFRRRLSDTKLYRSTATPSSGSSTEFLDVVERAGESFSVFWSPMVRLLRLLCPVSAYQVRCELLPPSGEAPAVVQVELLRFPVSSVAPVIVEEQTWERAVERAAHHIAATILPRTRQCETPPWTLWQDLRLPPDLFDLVQRFETERIERRYDEAHATMRAALRIDPGNLALRLELGKLQEKMDMHLDALLTYDDIIGRASRTSPELSSWWNYLPGGDEPWSSARRLPGLPAFHPVVRVARYRHALLLALGDKLAAQWWDRPLGCPQKVHRGARVRRRDYLRRILSERLKARHADLAGSLQSGGLVTTSVEVYLATRQDPGSDIEEVRDEAKLNARIFFATAAVAEFERLDDEDRRDRPSHPHFSGRQRVLPRRALRLAMYSARLRRGMAFASANRHDFRGAPGTRYTERSVLDPSRLALVATKHRVTSWPPRAEDVQAAVENILAAERRPFQSWLEHYNAACVYALSMLPSDPFRAAEVDPAQLGDRARANEQRLARLAVGELAKAVRCPDIGTLSLQRDWVLNEDPALDLLRKYRAFRDFEAQTFGSVGRAFQRGPRIGIWQQTAHVADIVSVSGREAAKLWARRAAGVRRKLPERAELLRWVREEREGWRLAEVLAVDNRDWEARHRVARRVGEWAEDVGLDLGRRPHPAYSEALLALQLSSMAGNTEAEPIDPEARPPHTIALKLKQAMVSCDDRLDALARDLRPATSRTKVHCCRRGLPLVLDEEWNALLNYLAAGPDPDVDLVQGWCERSSSRWQTLSTWFDDNALGVGTLAHRRARFRRAMRPRPDLR